MSRSLRRPRAPFGVDRSPARWPSPHRRRRPVSADAPPQSGGTALSSSPTASRMVWRAEVSPHRRISEQQLAGGQPGTYTTTGTTYPQSHRNTNSGSRPPPHLFDEHVGSIPGKRRRMPEEYPRISLDGAARAWAVIDMVGARPVHRRTMTTTKLSPSPGDRLRAFTPPRALTPHRNESTTSRQYHGREPEPADGAQRHGPGDPRDRR